MTKEHEIPPLKQPLSIKANSILTKFYIKKFMKDHLPGYTWKTTGGTRTKSRNEEVGGASNSAHLHGLAEDGVLMNLQGDVIISEASPPIRKVSMFFSLVVTNSFIIVEGSG